MTIGFALCGSFCTYAEVFPVMEALTRQYTVIPIFSFASAGTDSRFGNAADFLAKAGSLTGKDPIVTLSQAEPIGPKKLLDALIIAPCTGNTLAKLAHGIADTPVTMAAKSHLRNGRPVILAISSNDALAAGAENIGRLLPRSHYYFVPFRQDAPWGKPASIVADFTKIPETLHLALDGKQLQPILLGADK